MAQVTRSEGILGFAATLDRTASLWFDLIATLRQIDPAH